jgi:hypothetical protein
MLGVLQMDVDACIKTYLEMAPKIFPTQGLVSGSTLAKLLKGVRGTARFDGRELEKFIKALVVDRLGGSEDVLLDSDEAGSTCKTWVSHISLAQANVIV